MSHYRANSGIGFATARELAAQGAEIIMICRNESKGRAAVQSIEDKTGHRPSLILADLSDVQDIPKAAAEVSERWDRLDVLVNNAGGYFPNRTTSVDGFDMNFALNHLGYFALTQALRPLLEATPASRIVNVASRAHRMARLNFNDLQWTQRRYFGFCRLRNQQIASTSCLLENSPVNWWGRIQRQLLSSRGGENRFWTRLYWSI